MFLKYIIAGVHYMNMHVSGWMDDKSHMMWVWLISSSSSSAELSVRHVILVTKLVKSRKLFAARCGHKTLQNSMYRKEARRFNTLCFADCAFFAVCV